MTTKARKKPLSEEGEQIVSAITDLLTVMVAKKSALEIRTEEAGSVLAIEIRACKSDYPMLVGGSGRHIGAINNLLRAMGAKAKRRVLADLLEPKEGNVEAQRRAFKGQWPIKEASNLLSGLLRAILDGEFAVVPVDMEKIAMLEIQTAEAIPSTTLEALSTLFDAIGKSKGRIIEVTKAN